MLSVFVLSAAFAAEVVEIDRPVLPAVGEQVTGFRVATFGRYAVTGESTQGTAVQVVTKPSGPGEVAGVPGEKNGRLDLFLDRGDYEAILRSDPAGSGEARLAVRPFVEANPPAVGIRPLQPVETTLVDFQQRTWWVPGGQHLDVEVAGRSLADLRLWRDGSWLVDVVPACSVEDASPGRAFRRCTIAADLEEGVYALVAYGGASLAWSTSAPDQPLHLRVGIPPLAEAGRAQFVVSPFGLDRYLVPKGTNLVNLALPVADAAAVSVRTLDGNPFGPGSSATVGKTSLPPAVSLSMSGSAEKVVTVRAAAGAPYVLSWFPRVADTLEVPRTGHYLVATVPTGAPADSVDATVLVADPKPNAPAVASATIPVGPDREWVRTFNLLERTSVFLEVTTAGTYDVALTGPAATFRVEPLWLEPPLGYDPPALRPPGRVDLEAGFYRLTLEPTEKGIVTARIRPGSIGDRLKNAVGLTTLRPVPLAAAARFPDLLLTAGAHPLLRNRQPGVDVGVVVRRLPLELDQGLPLWLASDPVDLPAAMTERRLLRATAEDRRPVEVAVDDGAWAVGPVTVEAGAHTIHVRQPGTEPVFVNVGTEPLDRQKGFAPPAAPPVTLPAFPVLTAGAPLFGDLAGDTRETYAVRVDGAALFRLESTGLLATTASLRTRTITRFLSAQANGVGRNFLLQTWLGEGDYQLSVGAVSPSAGHLGVQLVPVAFRDGGALADGVPARAGLRADEGVAYRVHVEREGDFTLRSYGPGHTFRVRFEDADGFPLAEPEVAEARTWHLREGDYRVICLPEAVPSRRLTELSRVPEPIVRNGHGPHVLAVDTEVRHVWWETDGRPADVWTVQVPAPVDATLAVDAEMIATLYRGEEAVARTVPGVTWNGPLERGSYRVELVNARKNSGVEYTLRLGAEQLVAGVERTVEAPARVPVSVGVEGLYDFASFGDQDVRATLLHDGVRVAGDDDRPEDWNFALRERLSPGRYELKIDPVGRARATVQVRMGAPAETAAPPLAMGTVTKLTPTVDAQVLPITTSAGGLLVVSGASAENLGVTLERREGAGWATVGTATGRAAQVLARLGGAAGSWRVRVWSMDGRGVPATIRADVVQPLRTTEAAFGAGFGVGSVKASTPRVGAAVIRTDRAGLFELAAPGSTWWCPYADRACEAVPSATVPAFLGELWLVRTEEDGLSFRGRRVVVAGSPVAVAAGAADTPVDVARGAGGLVVLGGGGVLVDAGGAGEPRWDRGTGLAEDRSVALTLTPDTTGVRIRAAHPDVRPVAEGTLRALRFVVPPIDPPGVGIVSGALAGGGARRMDLGRAGPVRVVLGDGVVAARSEAGHFGAVVLGPVDVTLPGPGSELVVVNSGATEAAYVVDGYAAEGAPPALGPDTPVAEARPTAAGARVLTVRGGGFLHVRGAVESVGVVTADGRVLSGADLALGRADAQVFVRHGAGALLAWVDGVARGGDVAFGPPLVAAAVDLVADGVVPLAGSGTSFRFVPPSDGVLQVRVGEPTVARVGVGDVVQVRLVGEDGVLDVVTAGSPVEVSLRGLAGAALRGTARVSFSRAVATTDGLGPAALFGAGDTRVWRFQLPVAGPVGIGVQAGADAFEATLTDGAGRPIGAGFVQMPSLAAGTYYLVLHLDPGSVPVSARPAVVGLTPPDSGPPPEVVRSYLESSP